MSTYQKMNPEVKRVWINELRSGRYKQGFGRLRTDGRFCCLGVLCDMSGAEASWMVGGLYGAPGSGSYCIPPGAIERWAGLSAAAREGLITLNDEKGATFAQIADWIEKHL